MFYHRKIVPHLIKELSTPEIIVITGMRRVGKSTLLRYLFDSIKSTNKLFLDIDNPITQRVFEEINYDNIIENFKTLHVDPHQKTYIFLDEIQTMPHIVRIIKYLYDHYHIKFIVTGSSSFYLRNLFPESLAGRKRIFELFPLDFEEFLVFHEHKKQSLQSFSQKAKEKSFISFELHKKLYEEYLMFGGFPGVVLESNRQRKEILLADIFTSYFEQDVRTLADFRNMNKLRDLILLLSKRVGSKLEITKLSSELGVSRDTVYSYLSFLESTYFLFFLNPFSRSVDKTVSGTQKVYFCDTGLLRWLGNTDDGSLFENSVFRSLSFYGPLHYYQRRHGAEIDFILKKTMGFEAKIRARETDIHKLGKLSKELQLRKSYIVTKEYSEYKKVILGLDL